MLAQASESESGWASEWALEQALEWVWATPREAEQAWATTTEESALAKASGLASE